MSSAACEESPIEAETTEEIGESSTKSLNQAVESSEVNNSEAPEVKQRIENVSGAFMAPPPPILPGYPIQYPPFFANPFMAPHLPQQASATEPEPIAPGQFIDPSCRLNPFTGGYYLSPNQYQEMMQQYLQTLINAGQFVPTEQLSNSRSPVSDEDNEMSNLVQMKLVQGAKLPQIPPYLQHSLPQMTLQSEIQQQQENSTNGEEEETVKCPSPTTSVSSSQHGSVLSSAEYSPAKAIVEEEKANELNEQSEKKTTNDNPTSALINKQMHEIERQINRRIQNQNIRKSAGTPWNEAASKVAQFGPETDQRSLKELASNSTAPPLCSQSSSASSLPINMTNPHFPQAPMTSQQISDFAGYQQHQMSAQYAAALLQQMHLQDINNRRQPPPFIDAKIESQFETAQNDQQDWVSSDSNDWPNGCTDHKINVDLPSHEQIEAGNGTDPPVWVMRDSYLKRMKREEERAQQMERRLEHQNLQNADRQIAQHSDTDTETEKLLLNNEERIGETSTNDTQNGKSKKKEVMVHEPAVLIEGVLFRARYLGSTQLICEGRPSKTNRMIQAQEAVARIKAPKGEPQPSTDVDLFISTEKIMVLNTDLQDILMDHALRTISYIADIGDVVVLMARRMSQSASQDDCQNEIIRKTPRVICHVFESEEAPFIAQSIGQAFQVAYVEFLRANGIDDPGYLREIDYQEVLNSQELMGDELEMFARKETQKDVVVPKQKGEPLGLVVVESGWGSMLPTVVIANLAPGGAASRSNQLNVGDQIIAINGISLVGLQLSNAQQNIKNARSSTAVKLTVVHTPPVVEVRIKRPDTKYQLGFSVQNGVICSLLRGGIAERGGIRVGHRIIEINGQSVVAVAHEKIVNMLATAIGEIHMKTMPTSMFRLLTGLEVPNYI